MRVLPETNVALSEILRFFLVAGLLALCASPWQENWFERFSRILIKKSSAVSSQTIVPMIPSGTWASSVATTVSALRLILIDLNALMRVASWEISFAMEFSSEIRCGRNRISLSNGMESVAHGAKLIYGRRHRNLMNLNDLPHRISHCRCGALNDS